MEIIIGALIAIGVALGVELLKRPSLELERSKPTDAEYEENSPARRARFLHVTVWNRDSRLISRQPALRCHGKVSFYRLDGQPIFDRGMTIRWTGEGHPEPIPIPIFSPEGKVLGGIPDLRFSLVPKVDIAPGQSEKLGIAARFEDDKECYGWCNDNYFSHPRWRNPKWQLDRGCYLAEVVVVCAGASVRQLFRLINEGTREDFRLEPARNEDKVCRSGRKI
jgi:hypothetical protein